MPAIDDWKMEWTEEDHIQRQHFAKSSLQRNLRGDLERHVTFPSVSSTVTVVMDCCWAHGHRTGGGASSALTSALSPYLFCALSGGVVCVLNTFNFLKTYLFEGDSTQRGRGDEKSEKKELSGRHNSQHNQLVGIDCFPLQRRVKREPVAASMKGGTRNISQEVNESVPLLCAVLEGWLCTFVVDLDMPSNARSMNFKTRSLHRAVELPPNDILQGNWRWSNICIRFSPQGSRIIAVVSSRAPCTRLAATPDTPINTGECFQHAAFFCVLKRLSGEKNDTYVVEKPWTRVLAPSEDPAVELLHIIWWDDNESVLFTAWSDGAVSLMNVSLKAIAHTSAFCSRAEQAPGRVTKATAIPPVYRSAVAGRGLSSSCQPSSTTPHHEGLVALVVDETILVVFTVHESSQPCGAAGKDESEEGKEPPLKFARMEAVRGNRSQGSALRLRPGHQTYCSEDIPIRDIALFENFLPYALAVLLESGAMLTLDTVSMEVLYHRPLKRLFPASESNARSQQDEKSIGVSKKHNGDNAFSKSYFIKPRERPMAMCIIEHNTAVVLRST